MKTTEKYLKMYENSQILLPGVVQVEVTYEVILLYRDHMQRLYILPILLMFKKSCKKKISNLPCLS